MRNSNVMTLKDAEARILKTATEAGLKVESTGLESVIDSKKKFEVCEGVLIAITPTMLT